MKFEWTSALRSAAEILWKANNAGRNGAAIQETGSDIQPGVGGLQWPPGQIA